LVVLRVAMNAVVLDMKTSHADFHGSETFHSTMWGRALDPGNAINPDGTEGAPNEFTVRIDAAVKDVVAYLRTKLPKQSTHRRRPTPTR
jgi:hypothetical protein